MAAAGGSDSGRVWRLHGRPVEQQILALMCEQRPGLGSTYAAARGSGENVAIQGSFAGGDDVEVSAVLANLLRDSAVQGSLQESFNPSASQDDSRVMSIQEMQHMEIDALASPLLFPISDGFEAASSCFGYFSSPFYANHHFLTTACGTDVSPDVGPLHSISPDRYGCASTYNAKDIDGMVYMDDRRNSFSKVTSTEFDSLQKDETGTSLGVLLNSGVGVLDYTVSVDQELKEELNVLGMESLRMLDSQDSRYFEIDVNDGEGLQQSQSQKPAGQAISRVLKKVHNKRAKYQHLNLLEDKSGGVSSRASQPPASNSSQRGIPPNSHGQKLSSSLSSDVSSYLSAQNGDGRSMESEDGDDEEKDGENREANDNGKIAIDLTDDLLHKVFSFLDDTALCQAAMVCCQWRASSAHEDFWKILNFEGRRVTQDQVVRLCCKYPKAFKLNLKGVHCVDEVLVRGALHSMRGLQALVLGRGTFGDGIFHALGTECSSLKSLSITDAVLGSGGSQEIQFRHDSLCTLEIVKCRVLRIAIKCPCLEDLSLKRTSTASASLLCPLLSSLDVSSCHKLSDAGVRAAATACPLLASLNLSNCSYVSDDTIRDISNACSNLRHLDASYCSNISLEGVRLPMLIEMKLHGCDGINASSMTALSHCARLEALELDLCWFLTSVALDLPQLRSITLNSCRKFVELTLRSPALASISLVDCPALNRININSSSLQRLQLNQQQGLTTLTLQCPSLREIDLAECDSLNNSVCDIFSDGGGCSRLSSLILDNCEGLTAVRLSTRSLRTLSLVSCRNIHTVDLVCPNLDSLQLDGCDHLASASFFPVGLQALNLGICPHLTSLIIDAPAMTALDLRGCGILSHTDICCPSLSSLDASYCSQLTDDCLAATTSACPLIESLVLASCPLIGPIGLLALKLLSGLRVLDLSYTFLTDLSPVYEACPCLQVLKLSACKYLANDALNALHDGNALPHLRELDLSYGSLDRGAIEGLLSNCPHLVHVSLNGCANVYDLDWDCHPLYSCGSVFTGVSNQFFGAAIGALSTVPLEEVKEALTLCNDGIWRDTSTIIDTSAYLKIENEKPVHVKSAKIIPTRALQSLNCVGCPNIKRVVIPNSACCLHLSSLNLSLSSNVREVKLSCANLLSLNLSNCVALEELKLDCPRLSSLCLQACGLGAEELEKVVQTCVVLETLDIRNCFKVTSGTSSQLRSLYPMIKRLYSTSV
ncbi:hypothetical protein O6H91_01G087500 [Diphasiastrum complanatum]|uniref:Uncharacterized protein n=2 Tax=Diphasiastrum complanatum TaxID=34168 RepID=A0ACC2ETB0_DIPCM|nr:hypothetical protein O6H91_01G087500 [Diphasiastrum complanatum]